MSWKTPIASPEYEQVLAWLAHFMTTEYGYKITHMAESGYKYPQSPEVNGYIPDIIGEKDEGGTVKIAIGEAKSCAGLFSMDTRDQINAFMYRSSQREFFFGVPSKCLGQAKELWNDLSYGKDEKDHLCHFDV